MYSHNSRKPNSAYHIATPWGTACKLEKSKFFKWQDILTDTPPSGKRLRFMGGNVADRGQVDAAIPWERLEVF